MVMAALATIATSQTLRAHNLDTRSTSIAYAPDFLQIMATRAGSQPALPLVRVGDQFWVILKTTPGPGTTTGVGGYQTFYVPPGVKVVGAAYVQPVATSVDPRGFIEIPMKGQSPIAIGSGPQGGKTTADLIGLTLPGANGLGINEDPLTGAGVHRGTIAGVYADTGIFYSTDPRTEFYSYATAPKGAQPTLINNSGDTVGEYDAANVLNPAVLGVTTLWDMQQLIGYGWKAGPIIDYPDQRGNAPWGLASAVAGPQSGYAWEFNYNTYLNTAGTRLQRVQPAIQIGPWNRIRYPGSQISKDSPGLVSSVLGYAGIDASSIGYNLTPATGLERLSDGTGINAVRFAIGQLELGRPEYSAVRIEIVEPIIEECYRMYGDAFGGDAGGTDSGKDHLWRYFDPTVVSLEPCILLQKRASKPVVAPNEVFHYTITFANNGSVALPNVTLTDTLPTGITFVSAIPTPTVSSPPSYTWNVGTVGPNSVVVITNFVKATTTGALFNTVVARTNGVPIISAEESVEVGIRSILSESKTVTPATIAPGGTVTYTITIPNTGTGASGSPIVVKEFLPVGFTYSALVGATNNGVAITPTINSSNPNQPIFTVNQSIAAGSSLTIRFTALVSASTPTGTYCNSVEVTYEGKSLPPVPQACLTVGGGRIGDTVYRDWNGNGTQDAGDEGISGVSVQLYNDVNGNGLFDVGDTLVTTTVTDANGFYMFPGLLPGNYVVRIPTPPANHTNSGNPLGGLGNPVNEGAASLVGLNDQVLTVDFGYRPTGGATIGDKVFEDKNGDGIFNLTDVGINGATVNLYEDNNANGILDSADSLVTTTTTSGGGNYSFTGLNPSFRYLVTVTDGVSSAVDTYFTPPYASTVTQPRLVTPANFTAASNNVTDADFGYRALLPSSIGDIVFQDQNANGIYDGGDIPIPAITVTLYRDSNGDGVADGAALATQVTDSGGQYLFSNLSPDTYLVVVDALDPQVPAGYGAIISQHIVVLPASTDHLTADFPFQPILTKTADKSYVDSGGDVAARTITYTITPVYTGNVPLSGLTISDPIPDRSDYVATSAAPGPDGTVYIDEPVDDPPKRVEWEIGSTQPAVQGVYTATDSTTTTLYPVADTYADQENPTTNYGTSTSLLTRGTKKSNGKRSFIRFDLTSIPVNSLITAANLRVELAVKSGKTDNISVNQVTSTWAENTLTWNVQPTFSATASANFDVVKNNAAGTADTVSIIPLAQSWYANSGANYGVMLKDSAETGGDGLNSFASRETGGNATTDDPQLAITYSLATGQRTTIDLATSRKLLTGTGPHTVVVTLRYRVFGATIGGTITRPATLTVNSTVTGLSVALQSVTPASLAVGAGDSEAVFTYTYSVTGTPTAIGRILFSGGVPTTSTGTGFGVNGFPSTSQFTAGTSDSVLGTPVLTWRTVGTNSAPANPIHNVATLSEGNLFGEVTAFADTYTSTSIGDRVWADLDGDGVQDPGEVGIPGVTVRLYNDPNNNGIVDVGETQVASTTTDANGLYRFTGAFGGNNYSVTYDLSGPVAGYTPTTDSDVDTEHRVHDVPTLTAGQQYLLADFGLRPPAPPSEDSTIGDTVWLDANQDGVVDPGETRIADVEVRLYRDLNSNGVLDLATDLLLQTVSTDSNGNYLFTGLHNGTYFVDVVESDPQFPAGAALVTGGASPQLITQPPTDGTNVGIHKVVISATNTDYMLADFGYRYTGQIGDFAWYDTDSNGVADETNFMGGPRPVPNATVVLYADLNGNGVVDDGELIIATYETCDGTVEYPCNVGQTPGYYLFEGLPPGDYIVKVSEQEVPSPVSGNIGVMITTTGETYAVELTPGNMISLNNDFGFAELALVEGEVFHDVNSNGVLDGGEPPLQPVTVWIYGPGQDGILGNGDDVLVSTTTTNVDGEYSFLVPAGLYRVFYDVTDPQAQPSVLSKVTTPLEYQLVVTAGNEYTGFNFGRDNPGRIGDTVFADTNGTPGQQAGEAGIPGVTVELWADANNNNQQDAGDTFILAQVTDSSGNYFFEGLADGNYVVRILTATLPSGYNTTPTTVPSTESTVGSSQAGATISGGNAELTRDWGYNLNAPTFPVSGTVYHDNGLGGGTAGNSIQDGSEPGIPNVTVQISVDTDGAGPLPATLFTVFTDASGNYSLAGVPQDSTVVITVLPATLPNAAYVQTQDPDITIDHQNTFTMPGSAVTGKKFGYLETLGTIAGTVAAGDGNGIFEVDLEVPLAGATIGLTYAGPDGVFNTGDDVTFTPVVTGVDGYYSFTDLLPGKYQITETNPPGYVSLADRDGGNPDLILAVLGVGEIKTGQDFEDILPDPVIGDRIWLDENSNGIQEAGEAGIPSVVVYLYGSGPDSLAGTADDVLLQTVLTDSNGNYLFKGLSPGTPYQVVVDSTTLPAGLAANPTYDLDGILDNTTSIITPISDEGVFTLDFGYNWSSTTAVLNNTGVGSIGDRVWVDTNGNGIQESSEPGLGGVEVTLRRAGADGLFDTGDDTTWTTTTGVDGSYIFDDLASGAYRVSITGGVSGYTQSGDPDQPAVPCTTCDGFTTIPILLGPGDVYVNADFGYLPPATSDNSVTGTIFFDLNADGDYASPDVAARHVSVALIRDVDGSGTVTAGDRVVANSLTEFDGVYSFTGLPDGQYIVWVNDVLSIFIDMKITADPQGVFDGFAVVDLDSAGTNPAPVDVIDQDFGYTPLAQFNGGGMIGDRVFHDQNGDGVQDLDGPDDIFGNADDESGFEGVRVQLWNADKTVLLQTVVTDENGYYFFGGLAGTTYNVVVLTSTLPGDVSDPMTNTADPDGGSDSESEVVLGLGQIRLDQDFGYRDITTPNSIGGTLWNDLSGEGTLNNFEPGRYSGVIVELLGPNGIIATAITDVNGDYLFTGLPDGTYTVDVTDDTHGRVLYGLWQSFGDQSVLADNQGKAEAYTLSVSGGQVVTTVDFGYYNAVASVGNFVWNDVNGNGRQDGVLTPAEAAGIANVPVTLLITWPDLSETTIITSTDASGLYQFDRLLLDENYSGAGIGQPDFEVFSATPTGFNPTRINHIADPLLDSNDPAGTEAVVLRGVENTSIDFGFLTEATVWIRGYIYVDVDDDKDFSPGEPKLGLVVVQLYDATGTTLLETHVTDPYDDNHYEFAVESGVDYVIRMVVPDGFTPVRDIDTAHDPMTPTSPLYNEIFVEVATEDLDNLDFLVSNGLDTLQKVSGYVYDDAGFNVVGDGNFGGTPSDAPMPGILVQLYITLPYHEHDNVPHDEELVLITATDLNGFYEFTDVPQGTYRIRKIPSSGGVSVTDVDGNANGPNRIDVTVEDVDLTQQNFLEDLSDVDKISGTVYLDADGSRTFTGLDVPIPLVTIELWSDVNQDGIFGDFEVFMGTTVTDANGYYEFPNLPVGSYLVRQVVPSALTAVTDIEEPDPRTDDRTIHVEMLFLDVTGNDFLDAGPLLVLGDRVWLDENSDGVQDAGEAGIANVLVQLYDSTGNTLLRSIRTDSEGQYLFGQLVPGTYVVKVDPASLPALLAANPTFDRDGVGTPSVASAITLSDHEGVFDADFGYNWNPTSDVTGNTGLGVIGDRVWVDTNGNGIQDPGESGLGGVTVALRNAGLDGIFGTGDDTTTSTTTAADGSYIFTGLTPGAYRVSVTGGVGAYIPTGDPDQPGVACTVCDAMTTTPILLGPGDVYLNADFGYRPVPSSFASISGTIWFDANANQQGPAGTPGGTDSESVIPGVSVALIRDLNGNGLWDAGEPLIATTQTDGSGNFLFTGLAHADGVGTNDYLVWVNDTASVVAMYPPTYDLDGIATPNIAAVTNLTPAGTSALDFGYTAMGQNAGFGLIGDTIFLDLNGDGSQQAGESGLEGVTMELRTGDGTSLLATTVTDENGRYYFGGLDAGTYQVKVITSTLPGHPSDPMTNTGDPDGGGDSVSVVVLTAAEIRLDQDFGYQDASDPNTVSGTLWNDLNADGILSGESGRYAGVTVVLRNVAGDVVGATVTDAGGNFSFTGLPDGTYQVDVTDTANRLNGLWKSTGPVPGTDNNSQLDPYTVAVTGGETNTTADFGYYGLPASVGNFVWHDVDGDGIQESGELGIPGVTVQLTVTWPNAAGTTILQTLTGQDGFYSFGNLLLDENDDGTGTGEPVYTIGIPTLPGTASPQDVTSEDLDSDDSGGEIASVTQGLFNQTYDFGFDDLGVFNISGTVLDDLINLGSIDNPGDAVLGGVKVFLYRDLNEDGIGTPNELVGTDITNSGGDYSFNGYPNGAYLVVLQTPSGATNVTDADGNGNGPDKIAVVLNDADVTGRDFLLEGVPPHLISGTVREDTIDDGILNYTEPGILGVVVELRDADGTVIQTTVTDVSGYYVFPNMVPGSYRVTTQTPPSATHVTDADGNGNGANRIDVTVTDDDVNLRDFLLDDLETYAIRGTVRLDTALDGTLDYNEPGLGGVTVRLLDSVGNELATMLTATDGSYVFLGAVPGSYQVATTTPTGANHVTDADGDGNGTNLIQLTLVNADVDTRDFLLDGVTTQSLGDYVWLDEDGDGIQNAGESGIGNVLVQLYDADGLVLLGTTVTDANGYYHFPYLNEGTYTVRISTTSLPTGLAANPTHDLDGVVTPHQTEVVLVFGVNRLDADFGYNWSPTGDITGNQGLGAIGDRVWIDADGDGVQDPGEPGLGGVQVTLLFDGLGDGVANQVYGTTTTAADGGYIFDELPSGIYVVVINGGTAPTGYAPTGDPDGVLDNRTTFPIVLAPGDVYVNADFGYQPDAGNGASIGDLVWFDADADGVKDAGEAGIPGVTTALIRDLNGNGLWDAGEPIIATTVTDATGAYLFTGVPVTDGLGTDDYLVWLNDTAGVLTGLVQTYDSNGLGTANISAVTDLTAAGDLLQDFGYTAPGQTTTTGLIGDAIFLDRDGNNAVDPGEGLEGVTVWLYDSLGTTLLATTVTDANGNYWFAGLAPETYVVRVDATTLPNGGVGLTNSVDPDLGGDSESAVTLIAGEINLLQDFGYTAGTPNIISGTIWNDLNADGTLVGGETGRYAGVTVVLKDVDGNVVGTTTTDVSGNYSFTGLPNGTYTVDVTDTANVLNGLWKSNGTNPGDDNNSQLDPYTVTVTGGATDTTADFGYFSDSASLGNFVWSDTDKDGIQDIGEPGLNGVRIILDIRWPDGSVTELVTISGDDPTTPGVEVGWYGFRNLLLDENYNSGGGGSQPTFEVSIAKLDYPAGTVPSLANQGGSDFLDSDDDDNLGINGILVVANPSRGVVDLTPQSPASDETTAANLDFGFRPLDTPTAVTLDYVRGFLVGDVVRVEWRTVMEDGTAGFDVERLEPATGGWILVNEAFIPALNRPEGAVYSTDDEGFTGLEATYRLIELELSGRRLSYGPFKVLVGSLLEVASVSLDAGGLAIQFNGDPGGTYEIETTTDPVIGPWEVQGIVTADAQGRLRFSEPGPTEGQRFFRAVKH